MKKIFKLIVIIFCIFILFIMIDICYIFIFNRPLFVIENRCGDCSDKVYTGLFYDTYNCRAFSFPQIKIKGSKYTCPLVDEKNFLITVYYLDKNEILSSHSINNEMDNTYFIHYYGIESILITISGKEYELIEAIQLDLITIDDIINELHLVGTYKDGGSQMFTSKPNNYNSDMHDYNILKCKKIFGTRDIYIGNSDMKYESGFCEYNDN